MIIVLKPAFLETRSPYPVSGIKFNKSLVEKEI
jgi:hypothetical protein